MQKGMKGSSESHRSKGESMGAIGTSLFRYNELNLYLENNLLGWNGACRHEVEH